MNTLVPGGGQALLGHPWQATGEAALEISTFAWGYDLSAKSPMTLDGVPEGIPQAHPQLFSQKMRKCVKVGARYVCKSHSSQYSGGQHPQDITRQLDADILQEIGIKAHMVNIYNSYREAAAGNEADLLLDSTSTGLLFMAPFRADNVFDAWVVYPLLIALAYHTYLYYGEDPLPLAPLTNRSKNEYGFVYGMVYPFGSAAPEEMFYRGFLLNEFRSASGYDWVGVAGSSLAYMLSHTSDSYVGAGVSGLYLGTLTIYEKGALSKGIAFHFWSDVIAGVHAILSLQRDQKKSGRPVGVAIRMEF